MVFEHFCFFSQLANKRPLDQFFGQLGLQLGVQNSPKSLPRGLQNRSKIEQKISQKMVSILDQFLTDFRRFGPPCWPPRGGDEGGSKALLGVLLALGAKMAPRHPQDSLQEQFWIYFGRFLGAKTASKTDFGANLVDFWLIF